MIKEQVKIVSAMLLGDGCLYIARNYRNAKYSLSQLSTHRDYVEWQADYLSSITKVHLRIHAANNKDGFNHKEQLRLETRSHPFYTTLRQRWYINNRKVVSIHDAQLLDWQCLAIWYMDDGFRLTGKNSNPRTAGDMSLCTDNFSFADVSLLQKILYTNLGLPFNIRKRKNRFGEYIYRLTLTRKNVPKMIEGIEKYVFPSFYYKIARDTTSVEVGDIV